VNIKNSGISKLRDEISNAVFLYQSVKIRDIIFKKGGTYVSIEIAPFRSRNDKPLNIRWENTKRMIHGGLVLLCTDDLTTIYFATVAEKPEAKYMNKSYRETGYVNILIQIKPEGRNGFTYDSYLTLAKLSNKLILVETRNYFEAYQHFLIRLQNMPSNLPFSSIIIEAKSDAEICNPSVGFNENKLKQYLNSIKINKGETSLLDSLDFSQYKALNHILNKEVAIIQGPPGTKEKNVFF
jgi:hypothetical protein